MAISNKKYVMLIGLMIGIALLMWLAGSEEKPKPVGPIEFVPILPSAFHEGEMGSFPYREDFFAIKNVDRSDSATLLRAVAQHACQVSDTINLRKYSSFRIEYYEHGIYMNDSTYHNNNRPLYQSATEIDAFIYWIIYNQNKLSMVKWHKNGGSENQVLIPITKEVRQLFNQCR